MLQDSLLEQWVSDRIRCCSDANELIGSCRKHGVCLNSVRATLHDDMSNVGEIHSRIEAWFKNAEVNVAVDQETVEEFARYRIVRSKS